MYIYSMSASGTLYLIPVPIAEGAIATMPAEVYTVTGELTYYFVEDLRSARRFLKLLHKDLVIDELHFSVIDKHSGVDMKLAKEWLKAGHKIGVLSEAGCPGIADPGAELAAMAQQMDAQVIPLTGPSSIILALMASGLTGQSFSFVGYLPLKDPARRERIKALEQLSIKEKQTQICIETPYRNDALFEELLKHCQNNTLLCVAKNISAADALIKTKRIGEWKQAKISIGKVPAVFLILGA
jgi:16S rRNA (cytidine1402-2'-O)-methyltransferase